MAAFLARGPGVRADSPCKPYGFNKFRVENCNFQDFDEEGTFDSMDVDHAAKLNCTFRFRGPVQRLR